MQKENKGNVLTTEQVAFFKEEGYLILEDIIEIDVIESWRHQFWTYLNAHLEAPDSWPRDKISIDNFRFSEPLPTLGSLPVMQQIAEQLGGGEFIGGGGSPIIKWPSPSANAQWSLPKSGHIDGYGPAGWTPFMLGATAYLYDVKHKGGAFIYWPKSHLTAHKYFRQYPEHIDGTFRDVPGWGWHTLHDGIEPKEFIAPVGTVVLWHSFLSHTGSENARSVPRFGLFGRWRHKRREELRWEISENLWKYWAI